MTHKKKEQKNRLEIQVYRLGFGKCPWVHWGGKIMGRVHTVPQTDISLCSVTCCCHNAYGGESSRVSVLFVSLHYWEMRLLLLNHKHHTDSSCCGPLWLSWCLRWDTSPADFQLSPSRVLVTHCSLTASQRSSPGCLWLGSLASYHLVFEAIKDTLSHPQPISLIHSSEPNWAFAALQAVPCTWFANSEHGDLVQMREDAYTKWLQKQTGLTQCFCFLWVCDQLHFGFLTLLLFWIWMNHSSKR